MTMERDTRILLGGILLAAVMWFFMFSPWTREWGNFWRSMTFAGLALFFYTSVFFPEWKKDVRLPDLKGKLFRLRAQRGRS